MVFHWSITIISKCQNLDLTCSLGKLITPEMYVVASDLVLLA